MDLTQRAARLVVLAVLLVACSGSNTDHGRQPDAPVRGVAAASPSTREGSEPPTSRPAHASTLPPSTTEPVTTTTSAQWRNAVTSSCDDAVARLTAIPAPDGTAIDAALHAAQQASAGGDLAAAQTAIDQYFFTLVQIATAAALAGTQCGSAEPGRAAGATINAPLPLAPDVLSTGFGSLWITEHDGDRVVRVDAASGAVMATIDVPVQPVRGQAADGRMWMRTTTDIVGIDPATSTVVTRLLNADVGPMADRFWALDGALWICDGQRLHRYDPVALTPVATVELGIDCGNVVATTDLVVAFPFRDDSAPGEAAAAFIDPATNERLATVNLPVGVAAAVVLDETVFFAGWNTPTAVVVDRASWTIAATPDLGRTTSGGTIATDGTTICIVTADGRDVLAVDASTFAIVDTVEPLTAWSVAVADGALWTVGPDAALLQRFDR